MNKCPLLSIRVFSADPGAQIFTFVLILDTDPRAALQFQMLLKVQAGSLCLHQILSVYVLCVIVSITEKPYWNYIISY